jgi:hypothetical protein
MGRSPQETKDPMGHNRRSESMILTQEEMTQFVLDTLASVVNEHYPEEEREAAAAMLLNNLSRSMFQGPEE